MAEKCIGFDCFWRGYQQIVDLNLSKDSFMNISMHWLIKENVLLCTTNIYMKSSSNIIPMLAFHQAGIQLVLVSSLLNVLKNLLSIVKARSNVYQDNK